MSADIQATEKIDQLLDLLTTKRDRPVYLEIRQRPDGTMDFSQVEFITPEQLAKLAHVETRTIYAWMAKESGASEPGGFVPPIYRMPGTRKILFDLHESIRWIKGGMDARPENN
jgi:hypothetical protein